MDNVLVDCLIRRDKERVSKLLLVVRLFCCPRGFASNISCVIIQSVPTCFHYENDFLSFI
jgi:hypothetical protein